MSNETKFLLGEVLSLKQAFTGLCQSLDMQLPGVDAKSMLDALYNCSELNANEYVSSTLQLHSGAYTDNALLKSYLNEGMKSGIEAVKARYDYLYLDITEIAMCFHNGHAVKQLTLRAHKQYMNLDFVVEFMSPFGHLFSATFDITSITPGVLESILTFLQKKVGFPTIPTRDTLSDILNTVMTHNDNTFPDSESVVLRKMKTYEYILIGARKDVLKGLSVMVDEDGYNSRYRFIDNIHPAYRYALEKVLTPLLPTESE